MEDSETTVVVRLYWCFFGAVFFFFGDLSLPEKKIEQNSMDRVYSEVGLHVKTPFSSSKEGSLFWGFSQRFYTRYSRCSAAGGGGLMGGVSSRI